MPNEFPEIEKLPELKVLSPFNPIRSLLRPIFPSNIHHFALRLHSMRSTVDFPAKLTLLSKLNTKSKDEKSVGSICFKFFLNPINQLFDKPVAGMEPNWFDRIQKGTTSLLVIPI